jgi:hypothetical protein
LREGFSIVQRLSLLSGIFELSLFARALGAVPRDFCHLRNQRAIEQRVLAVGVDVHRCWAALRECLGMIYRKSGPARAVNDKRLEWSTVTERFQAAFKSFFLHGSLPIANTSKTGQRERI